MKTQIKNIDKITSVLYDIKYNAQSKMRDANSAITTARLVNEALKRKNIPFKKLISNIKVKNEILTALDKTISNLDKKRMKTWASRG